MHPWFLKWLAYVSRHSGTTVPQAVTQLNSRIGDSLESNQKNWIRQPERRETASDTHANPVRVSAKRNCYTGGNIEEVDSIHSLSSSYEHGTPRPGAPEPLPLSARRRVKSRLARVRRPDAPGRDMPPPPHIRAAARAEAAL